MFEGDILKNFRKDDLVISDPDVVVSSDTKDVVFNKPDSTKTDGAEVPKFEVPKFTVLDGKLKIGSLKKFQYLDIEGGEINLYKLGVAGAGAAYCGETECYKAAGRSILQEALKLKEADEMLESIQKAKKPILGD